VNFVLLRWKHFHHFSACGGLHSASFACNFQLMGFCKSCVIAAVWHMKKRIGIWNTAWGTVGDAFSVLRATFIRDKMCWYYCSMLLWGPSSCGSY